MRARLAGKKLCVTFATVAEMTQWASVRDWAPRNQAGLEEWLSGLLFVGDFADFADHNGLVLIGDDRSV